MFAVRQFLNFSSQSVNYLRLSSPSPLIYSGLYFNIVCHFIRHFACLFIGHITSSNLNLFSSLQCGFCFSPAIRFSQYVFQPLKLLFGLPLPPPLHLFLWGLPWHSQVIFSAVVLNKTLFRVLFPRSFLSRQPSPCPVNHRPVANATERQVSVSSVPAQKKVLHVLAVCLLFMAIVLIQRHNE